MWITHAVEDIAGNIVKKREEASKLSWGGLLATLGIRGLRMRAVLTKWGQQFADAALHQVTAKVWRVEVGAQAYTLKRRADHATVWAEYNLLVPMKDRGLPVLPPIL